MELDQPNFHHVSQENTIYLLKGRTWCKTTAHNFCFLNSLTVTFDSNTRGITILLVETWGFKKDTQTC